MATSATASTHVLELHGVVTASPPRKATARAPAPQGRRHRLCSPPRPARPAPAPTAHAHRSRAVAFGTAHACCTRAFIGAAPPPHQAAAARPDLASHNWADHLCPVGPYFALRPPLGAPIRARGSRAGARCCRPSGRRCAPPPARAACAPGSPTPAPPPPRARGPCAP